MSDNDFTLLVGIVSSIFFFRLFVLSFRFRSRQLKDKKVLFMIFVFFSFSFFAAFSFDEKCDKDSQRVHETIRK